MDRNSELLKIARSLHGIVANELENLQAEKEKLCFALKSSIEITEALEENIRTMNAVGLKFGIKPFQLTPPPPFIKQALKGEK